MATASPRWYLAQIIEEQKFEHGGNLLDVNFVLISATSDEDAYTFALEVGHRYKHSYLVADIEDPREWEQAEKELVTSIFRGLRNLSLIGPDLKHGTEMYCERPRLLTEDEIGELVAPKEEQSVFTDWIPKHAEWYIAEIIKSARQNDDGLFIVYRCMILIKAALPDEAFERAMEFGRTLNIDTTRFWGIRMVYVVHDPLEHGEEMAFERQEDVSETGIQQMICPKEHLAIFENPDFR
ncbi:MAG: DUF4288 domain-containing protein [Anaerolineae bacterium]|nr:DUF4288 domain-containing protein [Anaerolineae bacterium]